MGLLRRKILVHVLILLALTTTGRAQTPKPVDLTQVSLEDLLNIQVTSVSKREQKISTAGAAIFVIAQDDIRRSGATNIPDILRLAPGVNVARIDGNNWAVSIRGFNLLFANKVLVLIDGRSVYNPTFSGTIWNQEQVPLEDIERIEIIRGPGGTVWGANAVNGVINIITKNAAATKGGLISAGAGTETQGEGLVRYGASAGERGTYRVFGRAFKTGNSGSTADAAAADHAYMTQGGFRSDWQLAPRDSLTVQGDLVHTRSGENFLAVGSFKAADGFLHDTSDSDSGNILADWKHTLNGGSGISLQAYVARESSVIQGFHQSRTITDVDFEHHWKLTDGNDLMWGLGYRASSDSLGSTASTKFVPSRHTDQLFSASVQDAFQLGPRLTLVAGSKFEHNSYTGFEFEPSGQIIWSATQRQTLWGSVSRAIREPSRTDTAVQSDYGAVPLGGGTTAILRIYGNPLVKSERLLDFETGYRVHLHKRVSLDVTAFLSYYHDLQTDEPRVPFIDSVLGQPRLILPILFDYLAHARNYGGEAFAAWTPRDRWKMTAGYSLLHMNITRDPSSQDPVVEALRGQSPTNQFQLRSQWTPALRWDWDVSLAYTGRLASLGVPASPRLDTRVAYRVGESMEFSVTGSNLLQPRHAEFGDQELLLHTLVERSVFAKITWRIP